MLKTIANAINNELDRFGNNPDYSEYSDTEYAVNCVLTNRDSEAMKRIKHLYRNLCEGYISANYYREEVRKLSQYL